MINFQKQFIEHVQEANLNYPETMIYLAAQGSMNYNLEYEESDMDTKAILVPTLDELVHNYKPISYTHVRKNEEHIDFKDIRLMFDCFRKQNINFIEILFTDYFWINDLYKMKFKPCAIPLKRSHEWILIKLLNA